MKVSPELERQALNPKAKFFPKNLDSSDVPNFRSNATFQVTWYACVFSCFGHSKMTTSTVLGLRVL